MSVLRVFDGSSNFWDMHPQFKVLGEFKKLHKTDHTKDKLASSKVMWAIAFLIDPSPDNTFRNIPIEEKKVLLAKDYLRKPTFNWDKHEHLVEEYKKLVLTNAQRALVSWNEIITLRDTETKKWYKEVLEARELSLIVELDKIITQTPKFYKDYESILAKFNEDNEKIERGRGKKIKSLSDSGEI